MLFRSIYDSTTNLGKAGLTDLSCTISKDAGAGVGASDTSESEVDAANFPGLYFITTTGAENTASLVNYRCSSLTSNTIPLNSFYYPQR